MTNGPVLAQMTPNTDFLTYSEGSYMRTSEAFKFNGYHIVKVLGWETTPDGGSAWIIENTWGVDWGQNGYGLVASNGETMLDFYAIGFAAYPLTMAEYYAQQQAAQQQQVKIDPVDISEFEETEDPINLDEEELIDTEL